LKVLGVYEGLKEIGSWMLRGRCCRMRVSDIGILSGKKTMLWLYFLLIQLKFEYLVAFV
jgi:hypothetical protein